MNELVNTETGEIIDLTAEKINTEHRLAKSSAETAIEHAIRCGELLAEQKTKLQHGEWKQWVADNCEFSYPSAAAYMKAAKQKSSALDFSSIRDALGYKDKKTHVSHNSGENEWYTPPEFIDSAHAVMGSIDLDPASSEIANKTVQASKIYTKDDDGLSKEWAGNIWMNPPYSQPEIGQFAEKLCNSLRSYAVKEAIVLVNNATETKWFQMMARMADAICFIDKRVKFIDPDGNAGAPLQGQALLYFGGNVGSIGNGGFVDMFSEYGFIVRHV